MIMSSFIEVRYRFDKKQKTLPFKIWRKIVRPILTYADEAHHSLANAYQKVMEYFKPKLFLGMTATPDKRDDGDASKNVYELFHYQIAYEIRLQAVVREIREELDATVKVEDLIDTIEYDYPAFHLSMDCFWCEVASGELKLLEAEAARWLTKEELDSVQWLPADVTLIDKIKGCMS